MKTFYFFIKSNYVGNNQLLKLLFFLNSNNINRKTIVLIILFSFHTITYGQSSIDKIEKLSLKCQQGDVKSCSKLFNIAKNDKDKDIRKKAVKKLTDQSSLFDIAKNDIDVDVRKEAVKILTDQSSLIDIAKNDIEMFVRLEAVRKVTDELVLADIVKKDSGWVRNEAFYKITDQTIINDLAKNTKDDALIQITMYRVTDQDIIAEISKKRFYEWNGTGAIKNIKNQDILADIACFDKDFDVRLAAYRKITDSEIQLKVSKYFSEIPFNIYNLNFFGSNCPKTPLDSKITFTSFDNGDMQADKLQFGENGKPCIWCDGIKHTWIGTTGRVSGLFLEIKSDDKEPLQFKIHKKLGYVYIKGKGSVILENGKIIKFPICDQVWYGKTVLNNVEYSVYFSASKNLTQIENLKATFGCEKQDPAIVLKHTESIFSPNDSTFQFGTDESGIILAKYNKNKDVFECTFKGKGEFNCSNKSMKITECIIELKRQSYSTY